MKAYYLITNPNQGTWGRGETMKEALKNCKFTSSQDQVNVFLTDSTGCVSEHGTTRGRFVTFLGVGKVMSDKKSVVMRLDGEAEAVHSVEERLIGNIHEILDGTEWDSDTPLNIANLMEASGYEIRGMDDVVE